MSNIDGSPFMQIQVKCDECPDVHWLNSYYVFIPKIGPLRDGHGLRGAHSVLIENISTLTYKEVDIKLAELDTVLDVEYGLCSGCNMDREHVFTHDEFADFGVLNFHESENISFDSPENNFLDSTRQTSSSQTSNVRPGVSRQSELFRDSALTQLTGYLGSVVLEADIVTLAPIPESEGN